MKAVILCAGYATRLYPLTLDNPKALLPIKGKPLLDYTLNKIFQEVKEISEIIIVSNARFYKNFLEWSGKFGNKVKVLNDMTTGNENRLGGIGDLWFAIDKEKIDEDILVIAGDNIFDFSLKELVKFFKNNNRTIAGIYKLDSEEIKKMSAVEISDGKIVGFEEKPVKPKSNLCSIGIYLFPKNDLKIIGEYMKGNGSKDGPGYLIKHFCSVKDVYPYILEGRWFDIGSRETYELVNKVW